MEKINFTFWRRSMRSSILKSDAQRVRIHLSSSIKVTLASVQHFLNKVHAWGDLRICMSTKIKMWYWLDCKKLDLCNKSKSFADGKSHQRQVVYFRTYRLTERDVAPDPNFCQMDQYVLQEYEWLCHCWWRYQQWASPAVITSQLMRDN